MKALQAEFLRRIGEKVILKSVLDYEGHYKLCCICEEEHLDYSMVKQDSMRDEAGHSSHEFDRANGKSCNWTFTKSNTLAQPKQSKNLPSLLVIFIIRDYATQRC